MQHVQLLLLSFPIHGGATAGRRLRGGAGAMWRCSAHVNGKKRVVRGHDATRREVVVHGGGRGRGRALSAAAQEAAARRRRRTFSSSATAAKRARDSSL